MNSLSNKRSGIALLLVPLLAVGGCAHRMPGPVPSEADRATLGTVGIASATYIPEISFLVPAKGAGQGALIGTSTGFTAPFQGLAGAGPYGIFVAAAMGVVLAPFGAMIGASNAMPLEEARSSETALRKALAELEIQESLRDRLIAEAKGKVGTRSFRIVDGGPAGPSEKPTYAPSAFERMDSVLEVRCTRLGLRTQTWGTDPPMEFFLEAKLRLVRVRDGAELWSRTLSHRSEAHRLPEWAEDGGKPLKEAFVQAYGEIAEKTVEEVFFLVPLP